MEMALEPPERDLFLLKEIDEDTADEIIKGIIKINVWDAEQEKKLVNFKRQPIRLHINTPRRIAIVGLCNCRPN